jgi:hypothetical protein
VSECVLRYRRVDDYAFERNGVAHRLASEPAPPGRYSTCEDGRTACGVRLPYGGKWRLADPYLVTVTCPRCNRR